MPPRPPLPRLVDGRATLPGLPERAKGPSYRDKQQREVDVVLERHDGDVVGIDVKASATPAIRDFAGLRYLRDKLGDRFRCGVVLYTGADTLPFGNRLAAVPVAGLWA